MHICVNLCGFLILQGILKFKEESTQWQMPQITKTGSDAELGLGHEAASLFLLYARLINRAVHRAALCVLCFSVCPVPRLIRYGVLEGILSLGDLPPRLPERLLHRLDRFPEIQVYDVTGFMGEHPGGEEALLQAAAGGDASQAFEEVGHSSTATAMMKDLLIGTVEGYSSGPPKPFFGTILPQQQAKPSSSSGVSAFLLPLLALAVAVAAWYYFNFLA
ncbi:hypothetical protein ZIOFF_060990 [Zingiber officinale]|uniref:Cytochrome b5 heme-binding domain-containing protein n=1 Tax=Zingiber officinale TaxID=94328 RepID=A0A8J5FC79_ZINOF|nr:hypothetical protein ZIOFF_060990 [Zingiber officinale]